ncbi:COPI-coated vesicle associated protein [Schizosaccharomyces osmophilus]|uniref:COPI-coated vesicle associated protein n=1 Tax=Schizosaccharomyces osmophilus TaxID=2545709 RepID=A0AAE9W5P2_9SCHI|nr:COPI-coated vesicle associated protein [Schizosaccharomyces osmophilus]WBW70672.1 COPI-coated vesicle associated protein [Schizosaccharomyces osmophilus]
MDKPKIFSALNLGVGAILGLAGLIKVFSFSLAKVFLGLFIILFGLGTIALEREVPSVAVKYASFMFSFLGRGFFYLFMGSLLWSYEGFTSLLGFLVLLVGAGFCAANYVAGLQDYAPRSMRDTDWDDTVDEV